MKTAFYLTILAILALCLCSHNSWAGQKALILIDMQTYFARNAPASQNNQNYLESALQHQIDLINSAKQKQLPIFVIEYQNYGPTLEALIQAIGSYTKWMIVEKNKDGLFEDDNISKTLILSKLHDWDISDLIIVGANGGVCVKETILGALTEGYAVYTYPMGIIDFNGIYFTGMSDFKFTPYVYPYHYDGEFIETLGPLANHFFQLENTGMLFK